MFLKLYCLGAALALMPLLTQPQGDIHNHLFPDVSKNISKETFPNVLNITVKSNLIIVKCPYTYYRHTNKRDMFQKNDELSSPLIESGKKEIVNWVPLMRNSSAPTYLICGQVGVFSTLGTHSFTDWIYKINWNNSLSDNIKVEPRDVETQIPKTHEKCSDDARKIVIFSKKKENDVVLKVNPRAIENPYVNQLFYYFVKPKEGDMDIFKKPCKIFKGYRECPIITLSIDTPSSYLDSGSNTTIVNVDGNHKSINVILKQEEDNEYYRDEEISLSRMGYQEERLEDIKYSNITIISNFSIEGYDLVKLTYNCPYNGITKEISKKYYFAPSSKDLKLNEETVPYFKNETSIKPNCSIHYLNVGYLDKVDYNGTKGNYQTLNTTDGIKGKYKIDKTSVIFDEKEDGKTTISCTYKTLDGSITTTTKFINKDRIEMLNKKEPQVPNNTIVSSTSTTTRSNIVEKKAEDVENTAIKRSTIVTGFSMLFILLLLQL